jgi:hypothetical protein
MPSPLFWLYLPLHLLINLYFLLSFSVKGRGKVIWQAKIDAIKRLGKMWHKRKEIQTNHIASVRNINQALERNFFLPLKISFQRRHSEVE